MAKKSTTARVEKPDPEMYQIYVRVPGDKDDSIVSVRKFLRDVAALLSDESREVEVVPYDDYDATWVTAAKAAAAAKKTTAKKAPAKKAPGKKAPDAPDPEGGPRSPLYPLYVCHNKF